MYLIILILCTVSGDNANTLKDMPAKGGREEKEPVITTEAAPSTTALADVDLDTEEVTKTTISFIKDQETTSDSETVPAQQAGIRNASDARGIFSNMVKTLNRCK